MHLYALVYAFVDIVRSARLRYTSETHTLATHTLATYTHAALAVAVYIYYSERHRYPLVKRDIDTHTTHIHTDTDTHLTNETYTLDKRDIDTHTTHIHLAYTQCLRIHTHQGP